MTKTNQITVLIDGDSLIYFEMGKPTLEEALIGIDNRIRTILEAFDTTQYAGFLTQGKCFRYEIAKMLGDMQQTPEWEVVRKRNAYVNIYNPGFDFMGFL
jgi:hypothetical protein